MDRRPLDSRNALLIFTFAAVSVYAGPPASDSKTAAEGSPPSLTELEERWKSGLHELDIAGMAVAVVRDDKVIHRTSLGLRDVDKKLPVTPDTAFYIASSTKSFTAMAVCALAEEGKVVLDAPVKTYLPRFAIADSSLTETLTVRDLLSHAKGVDTGPAVLLDAFTGEITEDRYYRWLKDAKATGSFQYSNIHFTLAGRVIEAVTSTKWQDHLAERIFAPIGMTSATCYASRLYGSDNVAIPTEWKDDKLAPCELRKTDRTMHAAGGMGASANDLARWIIVNLNGGEIDGKRIVSSKTVEDMQRLHAKGDGGGIPLPKLKRDGYGLGWSVGTFHDRVLVEHGGDYAGAASVVAFMPGEKIGVVVLTNTGGPYAQVVAMEVLGSLLGQPVEDRLLKLKSGLAKHRTQMQERVSKLGPPPGDGVGLTLPVARYAGTFVNEDLGTLTIEVVNGALRGRLGDLPCRIASGEPNRCTMVFEFAGPADATFAVAEGGVRAVTLRFGRIPNPIEFRRQSP